MKVKERKKQLHTVLKTNKTNKMSVTLSLQRPLLFLDGNEVKEQNADGSPSDKSVIISKFLATNLANLTKGGIKVYYWSLELYKTGKLTLDKPDLDLFKQTVLELGMSVLVYGRIIDIIAEAEKEAEREQSIEEK